MGMSSLLGQLGGLLLCGLVISRDGGLVVISWILAMALLATMLYTIWRVPEHSASENPAPKTRLSFTLIDSFRIKPGEHPDFFRLIASRFIINMGFYTATEFLLYYIGDTLKAPEPLQVFTQIAVITTLSGLVGNFPAGVLSDRVSKKRVLYVSAAITGIAALMFVLSHSVLIALAASFVFGAGFGAFMAVDWALATNLLPDHDEARFMGFWHIAFTVPQVLAPLVGGCVAYFFNRSFGEGLGYRVILGLVILYLGVGVAVIRPIKERIYVSLN
jgi:MFS family permease